MNQSNLNRRKFLSAVGLTAASGLLLPTFSNAAPAITGSEADNINHIGPMKGYTPQIGSLISMLEWISGSMKGVTKNLTIEQLDHLYDKDSNTIGSLIMHVAATEIIYQDLTFNNLPDFSPEHKEKWGIAMNLDEGAREKIKGNPVSYYHDAMDEARAKTKEGMKTRDDKWLLSGETKDWDWNNYCKWFHVTEHFANHRGQITWYAKRLAK